MVSRLHSIHTKSKLHVHVQSAPIQFLLYLLGPKNPTGVDFFVGCSHRSSLTIRDEFTFQTILLVNLNVPI